MGRTKQRKLVSIDIELSPANLVLHPIFADAYLDLLADVTKYPSNLINNRDRTHRYISNQLFWVVRREQKGQYFHLDPLLDVVCQKLSENDLAGRQIKCVELPEDSEIKSLVKNNLIQSVALAHAVKGQISNNELYNLFAEDQVSKMRIKRSKEGPEAVPSFDKTLKQTLIQTASKSKKEASQCSPRQGNLFDSRHED